jgi:Putative DNA-binding domain
MTTPDTPPRDLGHIQRWMQAVLMHPVGIAEGIASAEARRHIDVGPDEAETVVTRSRALTALERLGIYGYAYYARLLECLREEFPVLMHALTQEVFDAFAVGYLQAYPSRSYTLLRLGANFPRYLAETRPEEGGGGGLPADWPDFLIDLATLELAFNEVFDGPGAEGERLLDAEQLLAIPAEHLPDFRLVAVSCLRLLPLRYPVHRYFTEVRRRQDPVPPEAAETYLAVTRQRYVVRHYELSPPAYQLLRALLAGQTVGEAIGQAARAAGPDLDRFAANLRAWFRDWAAEGFFRALEHGS